MLKLPYYLMYAGTLPFIIGGLLLLNNQRLIPPFVTVEYMVATYGLVIASFMAGSYWSMALFKQIHSLWLISNILTLLAWISFLTLQFEATYLILSLIFIYLLAMDYRLLKQGVLSRSYVWHRRNVTAIVVGSLVWLVVLVV